MAGIVLRRDEAIVVVKELLDNLRGLDGHPLTLTSPTAGGGYQIIVGGSLDEETRKRIQTIAAQHQLACQIGSLWRTKRSINKEPDTLVIYKPKTQAIGDCYAN
jgi:hypothetical protein